MGSIFISAFHGFIIFMMVAFIIFSILAASGRFDHWGRRFIRRSRRRKRRAIR